MAKQNLTMNDITMEGSSNKVFFNTPGDTKGVTSPKIDFNLEGIDKEVNLRKQYNDNITVHSEEYLNFIPYQGLLVRIYLRELQVVKGKLFAGDSVGFDKIQIPSQNVQGATWRTIDNPFPFAAKAVVVNVPEHFTNFSKGDVIAIPQLQALPVRKGDDSAIIYENFFVHPDSGFILPTSSFDSVHFGYAIISSGIVQGFLTKN